MSAIDLSDFLHSLALFMSGGNYMAVTPRAMFTWQAQEKVAADPYSVLVVYGGPGITWDPLPRVSVQCRTIGTGKGTTATRAGTLYETLFEQSGGVRQYPLRNKQIAGYLASGDGQTANGHYRLVSVDPIQPPASIAPMDPNRADFVFNFDIGFFKEAS